MKKILILLFFFMVTLLGLANVAKATSGNQAVSTDIAFRNQIVGETKNVDSKEEFSFTLYPENSDFPLPKEGTKVKIIGESDGVFSNLTFTKPGEYRYILSQESGTSKDYNYDQTKYQITVFVAYDENTRQLTSSIFASEVGKKEKVELVFNPKSLKEIGKNQNIIPRTGDSNQTILSSVFGVSIIILSVVIFFVFERRD
ncbi:streptococcal pilin isopeptide linkage domain [Chlamydia trachomatis]|nr:streptococcal pilin isopeptide linkage domain [Chlamydia trachomatis]